MDAVHRIQSLITLGIIKKETPLTEGIKSRKTLYTLEDFMFLFWYRFVRPNLSGIMRGIGETIYEVSVKPQISHFRVISSKKLQTIFISSTDLYDTSISNR